MKIRTLRTSTLWRLFEFLKPKRLQYFVALTVVAGMSAAERLFTGYIVKLFTDAITGQDLDLLKTTVLAWMLFAVGMIAITPAFLYAWRASIVNGIANMRQAVFGHLQRLPLGYYESRHSGEAMSILTNDVAAAEQAFQEDILTLVQSVFQGVSAVIFMLVLKWDLALLIIVSGLFPLVINAAAAGPLRRVGAETQAKLGDLSERLSDLLAGFQVVRTFNLGGWILERFTRSNEEVLGTSLRRVGIESRLAAGNDFGFVIIMLSYSVAGYMVLQGQTTLGVLLALVQLNGPVQNLVYSLGGTVSRIQGALAAGDRILGVLDAEPEPVRYPRGLGEPIGAMPDGVVAFEEVTFSYGDERPVLQGLSFDIQEGQIAALVGPSGSGKSTIFRLLMGHYPVGSGGIAVLDKPIYAYALSELRDVSAFVPQDAYLYSGSVFENIRYGKPDASEEEVVAAARASYAHDFILELPAGYDTRVGERGARLSGGQRQRIAIARALLKNAPILLLDEATSALDSESEALVQQALKALMRGRTTIAIAHRLSTIENADVIYVVDEGRVVDQGRHRDLVRKDGLYRHLYELQYREADYRLTAETLA
jgi:ABC-type multidrug transport system fused ATPase/permease subunit